MSMLLFLGLLLGVPPATVLSTSQPAGAAVTSGEIVFVRHASSGPVTNTLAIRHADGSVTDILTLGPGDGDARPVVSPDGSQIAFSSGRFCNGCGNGIMIVNTDGTGLRVLTQPSLSDSPSSSLCFRSASPAPILTPAAASDFVLVTQA